MSRSIAEVKNWMTMFRWIGKVIRDDYGIEEAQMTRHAHLETELGLGLEQVEEVLGIIGQSFTIGFPDGEPDETRRLEELGMPAGWLKGFYQQPEFTSDRLAAQGRAANPGMP